MSTRHGYTDPAHSVPIDLQGTRIETNTPLHRRFNPRRLQRIQKNIERIFPRITHSQSNLEARPLRSRSSNGHHPQLRRDNQRRLGPSLHLCGIHALRDLGQQQALQESPESSKAP